MMNKFIYTIFISFYVNIVLSQVSIGNSSVTNSDVILDLSNSNNGALLLSSKTSILPTGPQGMMIFDSDDDMIFYSKDESNLNAISPWNYNSTFKTSSLILNGNLGIGTSSPVIKKIEFEDDNLIVNWISNVESDMMGYNLYRKLQSDSSSYNKVNNSLIPKSLNIYIDRSTSSAKHYLYKIEAVDVNGNVSEKSNAFFGVTPKEKIITEITLTKKIENRKNELF